MRLAASLATATMGHALLLLGLGWVASLARSVRAPEQGEAVQVEVATPTLTPDDPLRPAIAPGDGSTAGGARVASIRRTARSRRPGRLDPPAGPTMRPASTIVPAVTVVTEPPAPAVLSAVPAPAVYGDVGRGGGESPAVATSTRGASAPGAAPSPAGGPGAQSSTAGVRYRSHPPPPYPIRFAPPPRGGRGAARRRHRPRREGHSGLTEPRQRLAVAGQRRRRSRLLLDVRTGAERGRCGGQQRRDTGAVLAGRQVSVVTGA